MTTYKRVPLEATEEQWSGLARDLMMAFDLGAKSAKSMLEQMRYTWDELPQWLRDELHDPHSTSVLSKGTRCVLIYRAMVEDGPLDVPTEHAELVALRSAADQLLNGTIIGSCTHDDNSLSEIANALPSDLSWAKQNLRNHVKLLRQALAKE